tara:strand:+ start:1225 stop:3018 length:1794 start_codon:yes stop_codon:yes gene_type:complete
MNFNLASPSNNGNDYTIQFREHITIAPKSTISLNFAELVRDKQVIIKEDGLIKLTVLEEDMIPNLVPANNSTNKAFGTQLTNFEDAPIFKGTYTFVQFRNLFYEAFASILDISNLHYEVYSNIENPDQAVLTIGIQPPPIGGTMRDPILPITLKDFVIDGTHAFAAVGAVAGGEEVAYTSSDVSGAYANYAIANTHYNHYIDNASLGVEKTEAQNQAITTENNAYLYVESIKNVGSQTGSSWVGLYSKEYAEGIAPAVAGRTTGALAPSLDANGRPKCFVGVEFNTDGSGVNIYYAKDAAGDLITDWDSINHDIEVMVQVNNIPINNFVQTEKFKLVIGTEIDNTKDQPQIKIIVATLYEGEIEVVWNSDLEHKNLPYSLMVGNITYDNAIAINSQIPFNWFASVKTTELGNGFKYLKYKNFDKNFTTQTGIVLSDANPASYCKKIQMTLSSNISLAIGVQENLIIRPNQSTEANPSTLSAHLHYSWSNQSYSILVDLPLNNFKNKGGTANTRDNAGVKKQVLANIVAPFTNLAINQTSGTVGSSKVSTVYQPYQPIISKMRNNQIEINSMTFQIVDMLTEEPATDIIRSVINFTID